MKVNKYLLNSLVLTATMTTSTVATTVAPVYLTHSPAIVKSVSAATTNNSTVKDHVLKNQKSTANYDIAYGGFWKGRVSLTLTYDVHFGRGVKPYLTVTHVATSYKFNKSSVGAGFVDAFFFMTGKDGITPKPGTEYATKQPETTRKVVTDLNNVIKKDKHFITGFYNNNKTLEHGQLTSNTTSWEVPMNSDGTFTPVYGYGASRTDAGKRRYDWAVAYNMKVSIPGVVGYSFVDEAGDAVPASKNKVVQGGTWTNVDGAKVPYRTNANGVFELTGRSGAWFPNIPHPNFPGYTFINNTTNFGTSFKFSSKPADVTYHYYKNGSHTVNYVLENGSPLPGFKSWTASGSDSDKWSYTFDLKNTPAGYTFAKTTGTGSNGTSLTTSANYNHKTGNQVTNYVYYKNATHTIKFVDKNGKAIPGLNDIVTNDSDNKKWSYNIDDAIKKAPAGYDFVSVSGDGSGDGSQKSVSGVYNHNKSQATTTTVVLDKSTGSAQAGVASSGFDDKNDSIPTIDTTGLVKNQTRDANDAWYAIAKLDLQLTGQKRGTGVNTVSTTVTAHDIGIANGTVTAGEVKVFAVDKQGANKTVTDVTANATTKVDTKTGDVTATLNKTNIADFDAKDYYVQVSENWKPGGNLKASNEEWNSTKFNNWHQYGQLAWIDKDTYAVAGFNRVSASAVNMGTATMNPVDVSTDKTQGLNYQKLNAQTVTGSLVDDANDKTDLSNRVANVNRGFDSNEYGYVYDISTPFATKDYKIASKLSDAYTSADQKIAMMVSANDRYADSALAHQTDSRMTYDGKDFNANTSINKFGDTIHVHQTAQMYSSGNNRLTDGLTKKSLDKTNGKLYNTYTLTSNGFGQPNSVTDLTVTVPKADAVINPVKAGTTTNINNPDVVKPVTIPSYLGLYQNIPVPTFTGWNPVRSGKVHEANTTNTALYVSITGGSTSNAEYMRPVASKVQKLTVYASPLISGDRYVRYTGVYAITAPHTWKGYDFAKDNDLDDLTLKFDGKKLTKSNIVSQSTKNNDDGTQDVTAYFATDTPSASRYSDKATQVAVNAKTAYADATIPWLDWSGEDALYAPIPKVDDTTITTDKLTDRDDLNPNNRSGRFTGPVANVVTADDPTNVKKYTETYTVSDDKTKVSVQKGYGFTNKITLSADTYAGWGASTNSAKASDTNATSVDIAGHKLTQSSAIDSRLLTQTQGLKSSGDATLYDVTKNSQSETTKNTSTSDTAETATTNALPLSKAHVNMQWEFANSWVRHGENATQFFGSAIPSDKSNLIQVTNRQFLTPTDAKPGTSYNMTLNYGAGAYQSFLYSNPRLSLTKTVNVANGSFPDRPDYDFNSDTSFLVTTPKYDNPDVGDTSHYATKHNDATKTTQRYKDVKAFINSNN